LQFILSFTGKAFGFINRPLRQNTGMHHHMSVTAHQQRLMTQPVQHGITIGMGQNRLNRITALKRSFTATDC
jgi:hypothetical protein